MNNYYNIVKSILQIASNHQFVSETHYGDIFEFLNSGDHKYINCTLVEQSGSQYNEDFNTFNFVLYITDRLDESGSNLLEVHSVTKTIAEQIIAEIEKKEPDWTISSETFTPFKWKFSDLCAGIFVNLAIQVPAEIICEEDSFDYPTLTITRNGEYSTVGYEKAVVDVHSTDVLNYFTLYPSNYIYANYFDPTTEIVANVKFTGDEDFYFCSDEKGLVGLYFDAEENETYAWWDSDRVALHFHKSDWEKGYYKIHFKAGRLQIGYLTWTLNSGSSTISFDPLYFGYKDEKTSPMEIEYITISASIGTLYDYRPKITEEKAELVEQRSGEIADIRTVYAQNIKPIEDYFTVSKTIDLGIKLKNLNYTSEVCVKGFRYGSNVLTNLAYGTNPLLYGMWVSSSLGISVCNYSSDVYRTNVLPEVGKDLVMRLEGDKFTYNGVEVTIPKGDQLPTDNIVLNRLNLGAFDLKYCKIWDENGDLVMDLAGYKTNAVNMVVHYLYDNISKKVFDSYFEGVNYTTLEDTTGYMPIVFENNFNENNL